MKFDQNHIREQFTQLQSKKDLVDLLNEANKIIYGKIYKPILLKSLTYYANPKICKKRYYTFTIPKKSGGDRIIHAPVKGLKSILRPLNFVLQCMYKPHQAATGFVLNKSVVDNTQKHVGQRYVFNIDLKDFFYSFDRNRVKLAFMYEPFNLNGNKEPLAFLLASLCTHPIKINGEEKIVLPQGSPTSPTLTNILCRNLDRRLTGLAHRFGATYTRYADDITFSSQHNIYTNEEFLKELKRIIEDDQKLVINTKKMRLQKNVYRQEVTGLIVNEKVNVRRRYIKQIRMWLYYWEKYGYEKAEQIFKRDYIADKGHVKNKNAHLVNVLNGKLEYIKMIKRENDETYKKLKKRFDKLIKTNLLEHNPKLISRKLSLFTTDYIIKWTTHPWDVAITKTTDFFEPLKKRYNEFNVIQKYYPSLWWNVIYPFVFQKKISKRIDTGKEIPFQWGDYNIKIGWQYPDAIRNWTIENFDNKPVPLRKTPFEMEVDKKYITEPAHKKFKEIFGRDLKYFGDIVEMFRREIQFREETNDFYYEVLSLNKQELTDFKIIGIETLKSLSFYTYTSAVRQAIKRIYRMIKVRTEYPEVEIKAEKNNKNIKIKIIHIGSYPNKESEDNKFKSPSGDLIEVIKKLISLCDFEIESKFADGNFRLTYLGKNVKIFKKDKNISVIPVKKEIDKEPKGFTFIFKFYI